MIHSSAATSTSIAPGTSSDSVMRNGGSGSNKVAPAGASRDAARAGVGANANMNVMRSLTPRDTQANSIASGVARAAKSNAPATVIAHRPEISAAGADSL